MLEAQPRLTVLINQLGRMRAFWKSCRCTGIDVVRGTKNVVAARYLQHSSDLRRSSPDRESPRCLGA